MQREEKGALRDTGFREDQGLEGKERFGTQQSISASILQFPRASACRRGLQGKCNWSWQLSIQLGTSAPQDSALQWLGLWAGRCSCRGHWSRTVGPHHHSSTSSGCGYPCYFWSPAVTGGSPRRLRKNSEEEEPGKYCLVNNIMTLF